MGEAELTRLNEALHKWEGIFRIRSSSSYIYIYLNETHFFQVPKRAFQSFEEAHVFEEEVRFHTNQANQNAKLS